MLKIQHSRNIYKPIYSTKPVKTTRVDDKGIAKRINIIYKQYGEFTKNNVDMNYKKTLCDGIKLPYEQIDRLRSIVGPQELKSVVARQSNNRAFWVPGERPQGVAEMLDTHSMANVLSKDFGASIHVHTKKSDGLLSVKEVLDQAKIYADVYAQKHDGRFIVGITDHNTADGCKEAVKILAKNPEKYKNLGVVLGTEISTKENAIGEFNFRKPEKLHILSLCINPFDRTTGKFLKNLQNGHKTPMFPKEIGVSQAIDGFKTQQYHWFSLAHPAFPDLTHRVLPTENHCKAVESVITHFKTYAKEKALYTEAYYGSYRGKMATDTELCNSILSTTNSLNLYKAGGMDTHGNSIFHSGFFEKAFANKKKS